MSFSSHTATPASRPAQDEVQAALQRASAAAEREAQAAGQEAAGLQQRLLETQVRRLARPRLSSPALLPSYNQEDSLACRLLWKRSRARSLHAPRTTRTPDIAWPTRCSASSSPPARLAACLASCTVNHLAVQQSCLFCMGLSKTLLLA